MSKIFTLRRGALPLLVSMPHSGEQLGPYSERMTAAAQRIADTDWHLPMLYDFLTDMGVSVLVANFSRYVVDLNRDPAGTSLYPGQNVTELCPTSTFAEEALYLEGETPDEAEVDQRIETYWQPYHRALMQELNRMKVEHGYALLWDAHSIASRVPRFFEGKLPDFNLGTNDGASSGRGLGEVLLSAAEKAPNYSAVLNGRFKGGYITRRYGKPQYNIHAVQLELSQATYMNEAYPFDYDADKAGDVAVPVRTLIETMIDWGRKTYA